MESFAEKINLLKDEILYWLVVLHDVELRLQFLHVHLELLRSLWDVVPGERVRHFLPQFGE